MHLSCCNTTCGNDFVRGGTPERHVIVSHAHVCWYETSKVRVRVRIRVRVRVGVRVRIRVRVRVRVRVGVGALLKSKI
jgi:hypothetical protein